MSLSYGVQTELNLVFAAPKLINDEKSVLHAGIAYQHFKDVQRNLFSLQNIRQTNSVMRDGHFTYLDTDAKF